MFIICRDRLSSVVELVDWLERAGCDEIYFLDNDSAYPPLLEYFESTPHTVVRLGQNYGHRVLWVAPGLFELTRGRPFVYTDPDVVPAPECPLDALDRFADLLARYRLPKKAGFGLRADDIPDHYRHKREVVAGEAASQDWPLEPGAYYFPIDTTFALYRPNVAWGYEAIRTGAPYVARHDSWYLDFDNPSDELLFYRSRASDTAHWTAEELDEYHRATTARRDALRPSLSTKLRWRLRGRRRVRDG